MKQSVIFLSVILLFLILFLSCDLPGENLSISERIAAFVTSLNQDDRSNIQDHFHPNMVNYNQIASASVFDTGPMKIANQNFAITQVSSSDHSGGGTDVTCNFTNGISTYPNSLILWMLQDGTNWKIRQLNLDIVGTPGDEDSNEFVLKSIQ
ncbi:MAG: hypothetical protein JXR70_07405 [Spirochaetales bacterium]|nr:hypothetical protein [Spirochaetales bacterium]